MKVIKPTSITPAMIVSNSAVDVDLAWSSVATYALNDIRSDSGYVYICIQGPSTNNPPATSPLYWTKTGPTNKNAMFDTAISTQTSASGTLEFVIKPGFANSLTLFGLVGSALGIEVRNGLAGPIVYSAEKDLDGSIITSLYEYFYEPFVQLDNLVLTDLPTYSNAHIRITLTGPDLVKCGFCAAGTDYELGDTNYGAQIDLIDYSIKTTSSTGVVTLKQGAFSKRLTAEVTVDRERFNKVVRVLEGLRATPSAWISSEAPGLEPLTVFGFYRGAPISAGTFTTCQLALEVEGII